MTLGLAVACGPLRLERSRVRRRRLCSCATLFAGRAHLTQRVVTLVLRHSNVRIILVLDVCVQKKRSPINIVVFSIDSKKATWYLRQLCPQRLRQAGKGWL